MPIFQPFIKLPIDNIDWTVLTIAQGGQFGLVDGFFRPTTDLVTPQEFQLVPVCPGKLYCKYAPQNTFTHISNSELNGIIKLSDQEIDDIKNGSFANLPVPQPVPDLVTQIKGKIKLLLRPSLRASKLIREVLGLTYASSDFGEVLYFQYDSVDISSLQSSMLPIRDGPLKDAGHLLDKLGPDSEKKIFQLFLLGLIGGDLYTPRQGDTESPPNIILGYIGRESDSSLTRTIRFSVHTQLGPIDPFPLLRTLRDRGHLRDDEEFLKQPVATSTFSYGDGVTESHAYFAGTDVPKEVLLENLVSKYVYPFSILKSLKQMYKVLGKPLTEEEWRAIGNSQKQLFAQRLTQESLSTFLQAETRAEWMTYLSNIFLLEALVEHVSIEMVDEWDNNNRYEIGMMVRSQTPNGYWYYCTQAGDSGNDAPAWSTSIDTMVNDHNVVWRCGGILDEREQWKQQKSYNLGMIARPETPNGYWYHCTRTGTSGDNEPVWPLEYDTTVNDGSVIWKRGEILNSKKARVNFLDTEHFARTGSTRGSEITESNIFLVLIDRLRDLGTLSTGVENITVRGNIFDEYEGVMIVIANGEVKTIVPGFSSLASKRNTDEAARSSIEGNRKYRFASFHAGSKEGINYAFITTNSSSAVYRTHGEHLPGWYYWGRGEGEQNGTRDADGKKEVFMHRGNRRAPGTNWNGSMGCIVAPTEIYYEMRDSIIDVWQDQRATVDAEVQRLRQMRQPRAEIVWNNTTSYLNLLKDPTNRNIVEIKRLKSNGILEFDQWDNKIVGTLFLIRPDEYEIIKSGERKRLLRRLGD